MEKFCFALKCGSIADHVSKDTESSLRRRQPPEGKPSRIPIFWTIKGPQQKRCRQFVNSFEYQPQNFCCEFNYIKLLFETKTGYSKRNCKWDRAVLKFATEYASSDKSVNPLLPDKKKKIFSVSNIMPGKAWHLIQILFDNSVLFEGLCYVCIVYIPRHVNRQHFSIHWLMIPKCSQS